MTLKKIINQLVTLGYRVTARKRTDGGYLIQSINDIKYTAAEGNKVAREILGISLSQKKTNQLKSITRPKLPPLPKEVKNQMARINRRLRRLGRRYGKVRTKQVRETIERVGYEEAIRKLTELERYHKGFANTTNILWLLVRIDQDRKLWPSYHWDNMYDLVVSKSLILLDKDLMKIYNILYDTENKLSASNGNYVNSIVGAAYSQVKEILS